MRSYKTYLRYLRRNPGWIELRDTWRRGIELENKKKEKEKKRKRQHVLNLEFIHPIICGGLLFVCVFLPLAFYSANGSLLERIKLILFLIPPPGIQESLFSTHFPPLSQIEARPLVYSMGLFYGLLCFTAGLLMLVCSLRSLVINAVGIILGYFITISIAHNILGGLPISHFLERTMFFRVMYLLIAFYICNILSALFSRDEMSKQKNDFVLMGLYGLFTGWFLGESFGSKAVVFSGVLFLSVAYFSMWTMEILHRPIFKFLEGALGSERFEELIGTQHFYSIRELYDTIAFAVKKNASFFKGGLLIMIIHPIVIVIIYHFLLENRFN
jgi:hypothetical protein